MLWVKTIPVVLVMSAGLSACTGPAPVQPSGSPMPSQVSDAVSETTSPAVKMSEVSSTSPESSESEYAAFIDAWGEDGARAIAEGAGIEVRQVPEMLNNQGKRIELYEELQKKFPSDLTTVWATDKMQKEIHVSAKSQEVLDYAKKLNPSVQTHLTAYSYEEMEKINDQLHDLLYDQLGAQVHSKAFVGFDPIGATIHLGLEGLTDQQKATQAYKDIQTLMNEHKDLIKPSTDYESWGPGVAEEA